MLLIFKQISFYYIELTLTYHQYLNELTYILFLKLSDVKGFSNEIPAQWR